MRKSFKIIAILIALAFIVASFVSLASFTFRLIFSFDGFSLSSYLDHGFQLTDGVRSHPLDIIYYTKQYADVYEKEIKGAWFLSAIVHVIVIGGLSYLFLHDKKSLYGDARFATTAEVQKAGLFLPNIKNGLFAGTQILVGKIGVKFIGLGGQQFAYLAAPTRSGKGVGVVVPVGLSYAHSMVVLDVKQELFQITSGFRHKCGHQVFLFNPFSPDGTTSCWNPLSYVRRESHLRVDDLNQIAICLIPDSGGDDNFFEESARKLFIGLTLYCLDTESYKKNYGSQYTPTIKKVLDLATDFNEEAVPYFQALINDTFVSKITAQTINSAVSAGDKTFASILATLTAGLTPWLSETVANATARDDFDLRQVRRELITIYLGIQPRDLDKSKKLLNLFFSQLLNENTNVLPEDDPTLKYQCLLLMDEGTAPGKIAILPKAVSYMAGYNMRLLLIVQSPAQLREVYGENNTDNILTNLGLKVMFKPDSVKDSEEYSQLLGKTTIKERTGWQRGGGSKGISETQNLNQRDLMMPQELRQLPTTKELITFQGINHPILADKVFYFKDSVFSKRQNLPAVKISRLVKISEDMSSVINDSVRRNLKPTNFNLALDNLMEENLPVEVLADYLSERLTS